jgi:hypothetical protein
MSIDITKLEMVKNRTDGKIVARCPACAECGGDKKGQHLAVWSSGKFNCAAYEGDSGKDHRKRVFELAGMASERVMPSNITEKPRFRTGRTGISKSYAYGKKESPICLRTSVYPSEASGARLYALRVIQYDHPPQMVEIDRETGYPIINGAIHPF